METRKQAILDALGAFVRQRSGLDYRNYVSHGADVEGRRAYFREQRQITRDLHHYRELAAYVAMHDGITADALLEAARSAYSGRLMLKDIRATYDDGSVYHKFTVDYCVGQYFPTEYRRAACAVLVSAIWYWWRENALVAAELREELRAPGNALIRERAWKLGSKWLSAGDWLRANARREFSRGLAAGYFR